MVVAGIYKIVSPVGKIYIGRSYNIYKRWREHKYKTNTLISRSIEKYGIDKHIFSIVVATASDNALLNKLEVFYISKYNSTDNRIGLNMCAGGGRLDFKHSEETINKMRLKRKGKQNSLGRVLSEETKNKIRIAATGMPKTLRALERQKMTCAERGLSKRLVDNLTGETIVSLREAARISGIHRNTIVKYAGQPNFRFYYYA
jgi:group I intron endonuclease